MMSHVIPLVNNWKVSINMGGADTPSHFAIITQYIMKLKFEQ